MTLLVRPVWSRRETRGSRFASKRARRLSFATCAARPRLAKRASLQRSSVAVRRRESRELRPTVPACYLQKLASAEAIVQCLLRVGQRGVHRHHLPGRIRQTSSAAARPMRPGLRFIRGSIPLSESPWMPAQTQLDQTDRVRRDRRLPRGTQRRLQHGKLPMAKDEFARRRAVQGRTGALISVNG